MAGLVLAMVVDFSLQMRSLMQRGEGKEGSEGGRGTWGQVEEWTSGHSRIGGR